MNLLGYLITLVNLQSFDRAAGPVQDLSINVADYQTLLNELQLQMVPGLNRNLDEFRSTGYYRVGNVGKYLSKNLREYIFTGQGNPQDQGVVLTLYFKDKTDNNASDDDTVSYFLHKDIGDEEKEQLKAYLNGQNYG